MENNGYYSLIQYVPNPNRLEAVNVGIMMVVPEMNSTFVSTGLPNYSRLLNMFPGTDTARLDKSLDEVAHRTKRMIPAEDEIGRLRNSLPGTLSMTPVCPLKVVGEPREAMRKLREQLVDV